MLLVLIVLTVELAAAIVSIVNVLNCSTNIYNNKTTAGNVHAHCTTRVYNTYRPTAPHVCITGRGPLHCIYITRIRT